MQKKKNDGMFLSEDLDPIAWWEKHKMSPPPPTNGKKGLRVNGKVRE